MPSQGAKRLSSSANLAKDAHHGRKGTSCPAMTPLRFCGGLTSPPHPHGSPKELCQQRGTLHPNCFRKGLRRIFHESHDLARCSKWARLHFSSACASASLRRFCPMCPVCPITRPSLCPFCPCALREGAFAGVVLSISTGRASGPSAYSGERLRSSISLAPSCATGQDLAS